MPVKVYVRRDPQGRPWPPDYSHEASSVISLIKKLWQTFHHQSVLYSVVSNLYKPSADLVIITEYGLGVVELKAYPGRIFSRNGRWMSEIGGRRVSIKAGSSNKGYRNPHEQVQAYADAVRDMLLDPPLRREPWLPGTLSEWNALKINTTVCFTDSNVDVEPLKEAVQQRNGLRPKPWENFSITVAPELTQWAACVRFEAKYGPSTGYQPYRLSKKEVTAIALELLRGTEWVEILDLMPSGEPYAYLTLIDQDEGTISLGLYEDEVTLGRGSICEVLIPSRYIRVSRQHAKITRNLEGIFIEDLGSLNGVYVNGLKVQRHRLLSGHSISLGGPKGTEKVCLLKFSVQQSGVDSAEARTEIGTKGA